MNFEEFYSQVSTGSTLTYDGKAYMVQEAEGQAVVMAPLNRSASPRSQGVSGQAKRLTQTNFDDTRLEILCE